MRPGVQLLALAAAAATCATAASGCADLLGIEDLPPSPAFTYAEASCADCVQDDCRDAERACLADPACAAWGACLARCPRHAPACRADCDATHEQAVGGAPAAALDACRRASCPSSCYGERGFFTPLVDRVCGECLDLACGAEVLDCVRDAGDAHRASCERQWSCIVGEPDPSPAHVLACRGGYPHPNGPERRLDLCRWESCRLSCTTGERWSCLDRHAWPTPDAEETTLEVFVRPGNSTPDTYATLDRATMKACGPDDCERCEEPLAVGLADIDEVPAALSVPTPGAGFTGCLHVEQSEWSPTIHWFGRPLTAPEGRRTIGVLPLLSPIAHIIGYPFDPARGTVFIEAWDCLYDPAYGLTFEVSGADAQSVSVYMQGTWVWPERLGRHTLFDGRGGVLNVPVGPHTVIARRLDGEEVARAEIVVRAGWVSQVQLYPRPLP